MDSSDRTVARATAGPSTWGLARIGADKVHSERKITGAGVRVAVLDTGIDAAHPDLAGKLTSADPADPAHPGGWIEFDADGRPVPGSVPHDSAYHGTHVAGTVAGGDASGTQIGVAPGAELMGGLVIPGGRGSLAQVIAGMQWAIAPYAADGTPAGKPADVVSMSLGSDGYADELVEPARNIARAGIFPAFAIGNECFQGSASPGNVYESVSVGATDADDNVADFSCGEVVHKSNWSAPPAEWPDTYVVPDVSAPGVDVLSALPDGGYGTLDGTSMATPHVSGTVALMFQAQPDLTADEALAVLSGTSRADDRYGELPNARYGHGRIDAYAAVAEAALRSGVRGTVTDRRSGEPLAGVTVARTDTGRAVTTDASGRFSLRLAPGTHDLALSRFGYADTTSRQRVRADRYTDVPLELTRTRWTTVSGTVTYGPTGTAVPGATVSVLGVPDDLTAVTDRNGRYTVHDVPVGAYRIRAAAPGISRSRPLAVTVDGPSGTRGADLELPPPSATERVSLTSQGSQPNSDAWWADLSDDGRIVAFASPASNLVPGDTNGTLDIFVTDRDRQTTERVSVASDGTEGDDFSLTPTLTADGRYVGFSSGAANLVPGDTNGQTDAFAHDRTTGVTERVSVASDGTAADGLSSAPSLSADGRYAVFNSDADNLVPGTPTAPRTSSCATGSSAPPSVSPRRPTPPRATARPASRPSAPTAGTSPSRARRTTWYRVTPTAPPTSSCTTASPARRAWWTDPTGRTPRPGSAATAPRSPSTTTGGSTSTICAPGRTSGSTSPATAHRPTSGGTRLPSARTARRWPSTATPPTSPPVTPTAGPTCSCATGGRAPRSGCRTAWRTPRATAPPRSPRSAATAGTSPSRAPRPTWSATTPTVTRTCSSTTWSRAPRPGSRRTV